MLDRSGVLRKGLDLIDGFLASPWPVTVAPGLSCIFLVGGELEEVDDIV